ncbi:hypothetical protein [Rhodococcus sp. X156]|uniref:hypothetical protein n=1 Tax=Rhodococcus sp. X156 TaxID=2499145 RepID=UPI000FD876C6|nr:hypothetical protein [Rhodococcus sp. X156]
MKEKRLAWLIIFATLFYVGLVGYFGILLVLAGGVAAVAMGIAALIMVPLGVWLVWATVRNGMRNQELARRLHEEGGLPDTSSIPRRPSGRFERDAADAYFAERRTEYEADPENWRTSYRLAVAYDAAGDRGRARTTMKRALELAEQEKRQGQR